MEDYAKYVQILEDGGVIACPTETLVGLLADAENPKAIERVLEIKQRAKEATIGLIIPRSDIFERYAQKLDEKAKKLAETYWPGPLTIVQNAQPGLHEAICREGKVGIRVPGESPALHLVRAFGRALTATSANLSGQPAPDSTKDLDVIIREHTDAVIEGTCPIKLASTIVDVTANPLKILREGAIRIG